LIVLIINARNYASVRRIVIGYRWSDLKKQKNSRGVVSLPGVRVKQGTSLLFTMLIEPASVRKYEPYAKLYTLIISVMLPL